LIKGVAAKGETAGWIGPPGSGKSAAVLDWFMHGATGRDWRGHKCKEKTAFVYFAFERAQLTRRRILAYAMEWGLTTVPIAVVNKVLNLLDTKTMPVVLDTIKAAEDFFGLPVGAITFDTFPKGIAAGGGDENSARDVNMAATNLRRLHEQADLHIALIGHTGKDESKGSRGSNANQGDWDVDFRIAKKDDGIKTVRIEKANDQEEGPVTAFRLEQVKIGVGEDLEDIRTSILSAEIPTVTTARNNGGEDRLSDREALALRALSHCLAEHGINPELPGFSDAEGHVCPVKTWRDELISRGLLEKQASGGHRTQFQRLRLALERKGQIGQKDGYVWLLIQHNPG
jgi:hypothetical protein